MTLVHDHHIHTLLSGHSSDEMTINNIIRQADKADLKRIVILEHVPEMPRYRRAVLDGTLTEFPRPQIDTIIEQVHLLRGESSARVLVGAEIDADPKSCDGRLLCSKCDDIDVVMASTHFLPGKEALWYDLPDNMPRPQLQKLYTDWIIWAMHVAANPAVDVFAHPGMEMAAIGSIESFTGTVLEDFEKLLRVCEKYNTAFDLNESIPGKIGADKVEGYISVVAMARDLGVKISIGSDAHKPEQIGSYDWIRTVAYRLDLCPDHYYHP